MRMPVLLCTAALVPLLISAPAPAAAQAKSGSSSVDASIGITAGTDGATIQAAKLLTGHVAIRAGIGFLSHTFNGSKDSVEYSIDGKFQGFSGLLDLYPGARGSFHFTVGIMTSPVKIDATGQPSSNGTYTFNNQTYTATQVGNVTATAKWPSASPYIGIGTGTPANKHSGISVIFDLGVAIGKPTATLVAQNPSNIAGLTANVAAAQDTVNQSLHKVPVYPVLKLGLAYHF